jgi:hypothetical protein
MAIGGFQGHGSDTPLSQPGVDVGLLRPLGKVLHPRHLTHLIEQFHELRLQVGFVRLKAPYPARCSDFAEVRPEAV